MIHLCLEVDLQSMPLLTCNFETCLVTETQSCSKVHSAQFCYLGWLEGIVWREMDFHHEYATSIRAVTRPTKANKV